MRLCNHIPFNHQLPSIELNLNVNKNSLQINNDWYKKKVLPYRERIFFIEFQCYWFVISFQMKWFNKTSRWRCLQRWSGTQKSRPCQETHFSHILEGPSDLQRSNFSFERFNVWSLEPAYWQAESSAEQPVIDVYISFLESVGCKVFFCMYCWYSNFNNQ